MIFKSGSTSKVRTFLSNQKQTNKSPIALFVLLNILVDTSDFNE